MENGMTVYDKARAVNSKIKGDFPCVEVEQKDGKYKLLVWLSSKSKHYTEMLTEREALFYLDGIYNGICIQRVAIREALCL